MRVAAGGARFVHPLLFVCVAQARRCYRNFSLPPFSLGAHQISTSGDRIGSDKGAKKTSTGCSGGAGGSSVIEIRPFFQQQVMYCTAAKRRHFGIADVGASPPTPTP